MAGPVFEIERSACAPTLVTFVALFAGFGSAVLELTLATFVTLPLKAGEVEKVDVIVADCPAASVPRAQGNGVVQAPEFDTKVRFAGVGSDTVVAVALEGPLFVTTIV